MILNINSFKVHGLEEALGALAEIADEKKSARLLGSAMRTEAIPILNAAKARVPVRTGALKRSLAVNNRKNRNGNRSIRVGPVTGYTEVPLDTEIDPSNVAESIQNAKGRVVPHKYAHLVEFGHTDKRSGKFVEGKPFLIPAMQAYGGVKYGARVRDRLADAYARIVARKGGKG